ncbi:MAG TPA: tetratricopeptide repeat protein [Candidatus Hydrogenedentes bacterium]|nr:tetratricopeptide repeat protein [Candidatus Hydrogenedentota bacterium]
MAETTSCPFCGKEAPAGNRNCPHCGGPLKEGVVAPSSGKRCPTCRAEVQAGDIICVACGTNLLTGQRVAAPGGKNEAKAGGVSFPVKAVLKWLFVGGGVTALAAGLVVGAAFLFGDPLDKARSLAAAGNIPEALATAQKAVESRPNNRDARILLGKLLMQAGQPARAADAFEAALKLDVKDPAPGYLAVVAAAKTGGDEGLRRQISTLRELVRLHPGEQKAWRLLVTALGAAHEHKEQAAAIFDAGSAGMATGISLGVLPGMARALARELPEAEKSLRELAAAAPDNGDAQAALGLVLSLQGQGEQAAEALQASLDKNPSAPGRVRFLLALHRLRDGAYEQALSLLRQARKDLPEDARISFFFALALQQAGLNDEALVEFERVSSGSGPHAAEAAVQMAVLLLKMDNVDRAAAAMRRASELGLVSARMMTIQGLVHARQENPGEAENAYRRAIQAEPDYAAAHLELGLLQVGRNALAEGIAELERFLELRRASGSGENVNEIEVLVSQLKQTMQAS